MEVEVYLIELVNCSTGQVIASEMQTAYSFWRRFKGLMLVKEIPENFALHIAPCSSIHTFFMKCRIDILYLNQKNEIVGMEENFAPSKVGRLLTGVKSVIELPAGKIKASAVKIGHAVAFVSSEHEKVIKTGTN
ncbi:DUF192 domain-containing protein [Virgibacillus kekensis]|uniref:DUF192 domain-containing protein n=1 Tax=Virgibacillus kekensis TaxID=202261 RepID=A0ABV9DIP6_9BACI